MTAAAQKVTCSAQTAAEAEAVAAVALAVVVTVAVTQTAGALPPTNCSEIPATTTDHTSEAW